MGSPLLTPREAAAQLRVSLDTLEGFVADGALAFVDVSRGRKRPRRKFDQCDIDAFIESRRQRTNRCTSTRTTSRNTGRRKSGSKVSVVVDLQDARLAERQKRLLERSKRI
jgi:excisionase family DNA binding protein